MSEATAGTLVGYLRLDASQWHEELRRAGIAAERLDEKSPNIDIDVNAEEAVAKLKAVAEEADRTGQEIERAGKRGEKGLSPLAYAIGLLGPAIAPLAGAAVGLAAGFGAMGAAGLVAVLGIKREMEEGTGLGKDYAAGVRDITHAYESLSHISADAMLGSFQNAVQTIEGHVLTITPIMRDLSAILGQSAVNLLDAALTSFETMRPVIMDVAHYVLDFTAALRDGAASDSFRSFVSYIAGVLPQVVDTLGALVTAATHLVSAFAPLGGATLSALELVATALAAIDPGILTAVATAAGSAFIAFSAYKALSGLPDLFERLSTGAKSIGTGFSSAATGVQRFEAALGVVGLLVAGATMIYSAFADQQTTNASAVSSYTDALVQSNGAITENVRLVALKKAQDEGAVDAGKALGLSTNDVVDAYLGQADALAKIEPAHDAAMKAQLAKVNADQADASTMTELNTKYLDFKNKVGASGTALADAKVKAQEHSEVIGAAAGSQQSYSDAIYTSTTYIRNQKTAMEEWRAEVDRVISSTLTVEAAHDNATKQLQGLTKSIKDNGKSFEGNTKGALANREAIRSYAESKVREAAEVQKTTGSNVKANKVIEDGRKALYDSMIQAGKTKAEAQRLTDKYLAIPKTIKTDIDLQSEAAQRRASTLKSILAEIRSKTVTITVKQRLQNEAKLLMNGVSDNAHGNLYAYANGGISAFASGGITEKHEAQIAPAGAMRLWAEPETGGEAYIPLHPGKRDRSLAIWEETGKRLGALGQGGGSGDSEAIASALLALASELRSLQSIPSAIERGMSQRSRLDRLDARARYSA